MKKPDKAKTEQTMRVDIEAGRMEISSQNSISLPITKSISKFKFGKAFGVGWLLTPSGSTKNNWFY